MATPPDICAIVAPVVNRNGCGMLTGLGGAVAFNPPWLLVIVVDHRSTRRADLAGDHAAPPVFFQPLSSFLLPAASRLSTLDDLPLAPFGERHDRQRCVAEHGTRAQTGGLQHRDPFAVGVQPNSLARMRDRAAVGFDIAVGGFDAAAVRVEL